HRPMLGDGSFDVLSLPYHLLVVASNRISAGGHTPERWPSLRGCDHLQKFDSKRQPTGDTAMITRQMSHRPAWDGVHAKP
ncbi:hypothetical protein, partial [Enterobacter cloacae]|uniref:hypothetical protein n=1 Tax=Enterobacter cloacae TaxID=550 RepID=UPI0019D4E339